MSTLRSWPEVCLSSGGFLKWVCLKMSCTPKPTGFADHYPYEKWLFHWEYTQHFQTNPNMDTPNHWFPMDHNQWVGWLGWKLGISPWHLETSAEVFPWGAEASRVGEVFGRFCRLAETGSGPIFVGITALLLVASSPTWVWFESFTPNK